MCEYGICVHVVHVYVCVYVCICTHTYLFSDPVLYLENGGSGGVTVGISFTTGSSEQLGPQGLPHSACGILDQSFHFLGSGFSL